MNPTVIKKIMKYIFLILTKTKGVMQDGIKICEIIKDLISFKTAGVTWN